MRDSFQLDRSMIIRAVISDSFQLNTSPRTQKTNPPTAPFSSPPVSSAPLIRLRSFLHRQPSSSATTSKHTSSSCQSSSLNLSSLHVHLDHARRLPRPQLPPPASMTTLCSRSHSGGGKSSGLHYGYLVSMSPPPSL